MSVLWVTGEKLFKISDLRCYTDFIVCSQLPSVLSSLKAALSGVAKMVAGHKNKIAFPSQHLLEPLEGEEYMVHEWLPREKPDRAIEDLVLLVTTR